MSEDYAQTWKKNQQSPFKIIIGKGSFWRIRLIIALTGNEISSTMKPGDVICVKKSVMFEKQKNLVWRGQEQAFWMTINKLSRKI